MLLWRSGIHVPISPLSSWGAGKISDSRWFICVLSLDVDLASGSPPDPQSLLGEAHPLHYSNIVEEFDNPILLFLKVKLLKFKRRTLRKHWEASHLAVGPL